MVRKQNKPIRPNRAEKATLALLAAQLKKNTKRTIRPLGDVIRIVRPETVIRWHRELVRVWCKNFIRTDSSREVLFYITECMMSDKITPHSI